MVEPVRPMVLSSILSLSATFIIACGAGDGEVVPHQVGDGVYDAADAPDVPDDGSSRDGGRQSCETVTATCAGPGTYQFHGKAYYADCSGSWIQERCVLTGDIYCCMYW